MSRWIEERAQELREASGGDLARLAEILAPEIVIRECAVAALCIHLGDGRALIYAPPGSDLLRHEIGHAIGSAGLGPELERQGCPWARLQIWREEAIAERFAVTYDAGDEKGMRKG